MTLCPQTGFKRDFDAEQRAYDARWRAIYPRSTAEEAHIDRVCSRFELESDEFQTREEKARAMIARGEG